MQRALIVEYRKMSVAQHEPQLKPRIAQQRGETAIGAVERPRIVSGELQGGDGAAVVMHGAYLAAAGQLNQGSLRIQFRILGAVTKRHRSACVGSPGTELEFAL